MHSAVQHCFRLLAVSSLDHCRPAIKSQPSMRRGHGQRASGLKRQPRTPSLTGKESSGSVGASSHYRPSTTTTTHLHEASRERPIDGDMWEGGVHGSHQEAARLLPPWLGGPAAFADPVGAAAGAGFGVGGYACDVVGQAGGVFGFGFEAAVVAAQQQQQQRAAEAAAAAAGGSKAVVSGLLGSLQAELGRMNAGEIMDAKALAASRSHSEAERRRRQRINGHLARLRSLLPNTTKTDKASLLAEVLEHVKELKRQTSAMTMMAAAAVGGDEDDDGAPVQMLPTEADELGVDATEDGEGRLVVRASLCCEDRPDLIPDIIRALAVLRLRAHRAEITTLGGRVRSVLLITAEEGEEGDDDGGRVNGDGIDEECAASHRRHECIASVQEALRGVMDRRAACSNDTSSSGGGGGGSIKRQRMNYGAHKQCSA